MCGRLTKIPQQFSVIWDRIKNCQTTEFRTITGLGFSYYVQNNTLHILRDGHKINQALAKSNFSETYAIMLVRPIKGPGALNDIAIERGEAQKRGPSYVWAILHDKRIV
jgi:hypothetical protein